MEVFFVLKIAFFFHAKKKKKRDGITNKEKLYMVENVFNSITGEKGYKSQLRTRVMRYSKSFVPESRVSIIQFKMNYRNIFLCNILSQHLENLIILLSERGIILGTSIILVLFMWYTYNLLLLFLFYGLIIKLLWVNSLVLNPDFEKTPVG